ncbi:MAG: DUF2203 domain-containing protein [Acidobacteriia bacterium]|nr:DUF2203 domain-containing protein [Terriglobia bacterium]
MPRYFTHSQATQALAGLIPGVRQAVRLKQEYDRVEGEIQAFAQKVHLMGGMVVDRKQILAQRSHRDATLLRLKELLEEIQEKGCHIKDLDTGLLDFLTLYHGQEVCLCWKLGETAIEYWHSTEEGFRGRKPIDKEFLDNHKGGLV